MVACLSVNTDGFDDFPQGACCEIVLQNKKNADR
jgi:hypothetical protein